MLTGFTDASAQRIVTEAHFVAWLVAITRLADDIRQTMFTILTVAPAGLAVILLSCAVMNIVLPANPVEFGHAVMHDVGSGMAIQRVACTVPAPVPFTKLRDILGK
ncbi:hypothetical protein NL54_17085 [Pantoea stewartii]|nr:hypothetical protein NL54_17085 [Pantoea stewartii]KHN65371.1 hypothetical protein OI73_01630 [Pantoea stewartii]